MSAPVPTLKECMLAAERMNLRSQRTRKGTPTARSLLFQVCSPTSRASSRRYSTGRINAQRAGALFIAADTDAQHVNPALLRASALLYDYVYLRDAESFSESVAYLALQLLRSGWRHDDYEVARDLAEQTAASTRSAWWSEGAD